MTHDQAFKPRTSSSFDPTRSYTKIKCTVFSVVKFRSCTQRAPALVKHYYNAREIPTVGWHEVDASKWKLFISLQHTPIQQDL